MFHHNIHRNSETLFGLLKAKKSVFEHAQNVQIYIILRMRSVSSGPSVLQYPMSLTTDSETPDQTGNLLSVHAPKTHFRFAQLK